MESISAVVGEMIPELPPLESGLSVEQITVELPLELYVRDGGGELRLEASAPRQRAATSILPVFHRLRVLVDAHQENAR